MNVDIKAIDNSDGLDFICDLDIVLIFSNLIDNAIDAASQCDNKTVNINIDHYNQFTYVTIDNHYKTINKVSEGKFFTTKQKHSGYGLHIIKNAVSNYNGTLTIKSSNNIFTVKILFY